ncbi:MAG: phosphatase PAP2-related protein [Phycisphaeraceae bacterium]
MPQRRVILRRVALIVGGLAAWFTTQALIAGRGFPEGSIGDGLFNLTAPVNDWLMNHPGAADGLLIVSSALIDLVGVFLLLRAIFGPTIRPFLGLLILFALRQVCQAVCALPAPEGMIWRHPGWPSLLVTYATANDFFFSGHTAIAVFGATELARLPGRGWKWLGAALALFEMSVVIILRAHYTMDVFAGAAAALAVAFIVARLAPPVDRGLGGATSGGTN